MSLFSADSEVSNMSVEECRLREENLKLSRQLYWEREQRLKLSRALSESNSSLEMDEERLVHESSGGGGEEGGWLNTPQRRG